MNRTFIALSLLAVVSSASVAAEKTLNHNKVADTFLTALNSQNLSNIENFVVSHFSKDALSRWEGTGKDRYVGYSMNKALYLGNLEVLDSKLETTDNGLQHISTLYSKNIDMQYRMVIYFNNEQQRAITGWYIGENPKDTSHLSKLSDDRFVEEVKSYSTRLANNGAFSGAILLAKGDKVLFSAAHGLASRRYDVPNNLNTKFQIGSMNKMFTSTAILQLVEQGKMSLDDPMTKYIDPNLLGEGDFSKIKIKHLLSHTSGIGNGEGFNAIQNKVRSLKDITPLLASIDTTFEPGSRWRYSNNGMMLLGKIIENVSGESYFDFINKHVYAKADMRNSGSFDLDVPVKNTARNYWFSVETGQITENLMFQSVKGGPAGGGYSTVSDLHKFAIAMQNGKLISKSLAQQALSAKPELNANNWGYGFSIRGDEENTIIGHNGQHLGMTARLNMYQEKGYILVVLGNYESSAWPVIAKVNQLMKRL
ncbi:oxidoreductase [Pseudoalteromonas phenolica]|uniref:serine hydrolase domain-containing protein n=1 Tax=Pseudoalteromonas phenolica TaxID=161398 RepID=UPI00110AE916|nr:serine hydrolase domain-containing protein [Pseudoalteromonas phenolica]TMN93720.1 oxidoreductase [Pseudoalteromonas phenolica]